MTNNAVYTQHEGHNPTNVTCLFPRSDSGYGSIDEGSADSPTSPHYSRGSFVEHNDEHEIGSHHGPGTSAERSNVEAPCAIPEQLPKLSQASCSSLALYRPFLAWKPQQLNLVPSSKDATSTPPSRQKCGGGGLRTLDRFVPRRDSDEPSRQVYQTTKSFQDLSPTEKLLRRKRAPLTPFSTPQRPQARVSDETRAALAGQSLGRGLSSFSTKGEEGDRAVEFDLLIKIDSEEPSFTHLLGHETAKPRERMDSRRPGSWNRDGGNRS